MNKLKTIATGLAVPAVLVASTYLPVAGTATSSVAAGRARAIQTARSTVKIRHIVVPAAVAAAAALSVAAAVAPTGPATVPAATISTTATPPPTTTTTVTAAPTPRSVAAVAAPDVPATPAVPDLTGGPGKATNAPLVPGHWTQSTNGAIYRDPSPGIQAYPTVGANDPAYEAGLNAQLCMPGKPEFCQP